MPNHRIPELTAFLQELIDHDVAFANASFTELHERGNEDNALHAAAWRGNVPIAKELIELGVDINSKGDMNQTALHIAIGKQNTGIIELLLENGANLFAVDQLHGQPPCFSAMLHKHDNLLTHLFEKLLGEIKSGDDRRILKSWIAFHESQRDRLQLKLDSLGSSDNAP